MPGKGPVPKRSDQRLGHANRAGQAKEISKAPSGAPASASVTWPAAEDLWHPVATRWYESLRDSGQAVYYEPSDVALAVYVAHAMSDTLLADKMSAVMFANVVSAAGELLTSEGSRRRLRVELQKDAPEDEEQLAAVADIQEQRARLRSVA